MYFIFYLSWAFSCFEILFASLIWVDIPSPFRLNNFEQNRKIYFRSLWSILTAVRRILICWNEEGSNEKKQHSESIHLISSGGIKITHRPLVFFAAVFNAIFFQTAGNKFISILINFIYQLMWTSPKTAKEKKISQFLRQQKTPTLLPSINYLDGHEANTYYKIYDWVFSVHFKCHTHTHTKRSPPSMRQHTQHSKIRGSVLYFAF